MIMTVFISRTLAWSRFLNNYQSPLSDGYPNIASTLQQKDMLIVEPITEFILYRVQIGHLFSDSGWGFPYSSPPMSYLSPNELPPRWTPFDWHGSLYAQRSRFPHLSALARERLEMLGLRVRMLHTFDNERGIYIRWDVVDPTTRGIWNDGWSFTERNKNRWPSKMHEPVRRYYGGWGLDGEDACLGEPEALCRLKRFLHDPIDFFQNY
jgi:hypothetical protein